MRARLVELVSRRRRELGWTQRQLAAALGSSPSRVSKLERGDPSVSLDLLARALETMSLPVAVDPIEHADPLADPTLSAVQRRDMARELYLRALAARIASQHRVDAGDVKHALTNLDRPPLERLGRMFQRAGLARRTVH
jgi:transcriptional regulator with XRE-family HTH domain